MPLLFVAHLAASITALFLVGNNIGGGIPAEIANCKQLTHLHLSGNQFSGSLPNSLAMLGNLKRLDISHNKFSGELPGLSRISCLTMFLVQDNQLSGEIPKLDFCNLVYFNVSNNNFSGLIPDVGGRFSISSFLGNPELCGNPVPKECPPVPEKGDNQSNGDSKDQTVMYTGYVVLALACLMFIIFKLCKRKKRKERLEGLEAVNKVAVVDDSVSKVGASSIEYKTGVSRSEYMGSSSESALVLNSMVVLENTAVNGLKLEDLLSAPAELLGRGKHGTLYKVMFENGILVVKRIKDWAISCNEFEQRMKRIDQVKHRNVLPTLAFCC
ncbi:probable inactive receptor kinase At2g26730 [Fagus crenata]